MADTVKEFFDTLAERADSEKTAGMNNSYLFDIELWNSSNQRVYQQFETQTVGSTKTVKADFRLITATNDNLQNSVKSGAFLGLAATATTTRSNNRTQRRTSSSWPRVIGSNVPGYMAPIFTAKTARLRRLRPAL